MNQVRTVSDRPVSMIINTHPHPDHIGSNDYFAAAVEVVTHENTRKWMAANPQVSANPVVMPDPDLHRHADDRPRQGPDRPPLLRGRPYQRRRLRGLPAVRAMAAGDIFAWKMAPLIDPMTGGSVIALPDTLERALKGIRNVDTVIEGHGDVNTWSGFRDYAQFSRALLDAAKAGLGKRKAEEIAADLKPKFPVFTKEELLADMEYGGTPLSRAVINVNVAFQELKGEPVTTNFGGPLLGRTENQGPRQEFSPS